MPRRCRPFAGLTLIELLVVIAVLGILVGLAMPSSQPSLHEQLRSTARILANDLAYARSLAVSNGSRYRVTSGTAASLDTLPDSAFKSPGDPTDKHIVDLDDLPHLGATVQLVAAASVDPLVTKVGDVEFGPLGETTRTGQTVVWLGAGSGGLRRYIAVSVNPVTGLAEVGDFTAEGPPASLLTATETATAGG
jgi:prepilin-type N-terminal cleavage/methylation domain-containing protein